MEGVGVGIFSKKSVTVQTPAEQFGAAIDARLEEMLPHVPKTMPDGSPFNGDEAMRRLTVIGKWSASNGSDEFVNVRIIALKIMATYALLGSPDAKARASLYADVAYVRGILIDGGFPDIERALSACMEPLIRYENAADIPVVNDLEHLLKEE